MKRNITPPNIRMRSLTAGVFIGLGAMVYMATPGIIGALLFCIGLMGVVKFDALLFTGKIGYIDNDKFTFMLYLRILFYNVIGIWLVCSMFAIYMPEKYITAATSIVQSRLLTKNIYLGAIGCGMLMTYAVYGFRNREKETPALSYLNILWAVPVFIMCGFPHCIADVGYYTVWLHHGNPAAVTLESGLHIFFQWLITVFGNAAGGYFMACLTPEGLSDQSSNSNA